MSLDFVRLAENAEARVQKGPVGGVTLCRKSRRIGENSCGKVGQCWVTPNPVRSEGTIYYSPSGFNTYILLFENTTPAVEPANNVLVTKTRIVQPTRIYNGCPIGAMDKLEIVNAPVYNPVDGSFEYTLNAQQYIGGYYWSNGGGGRGGGSSGCYSQQEQRCRMGR